MEERKASLPAPQRQSLYSFAVGDGSDDGGEEGGGVGNGGRSAPVRKNRPRETGDLLDLDLSEGELGLNMAEYVFTSPKMKIKDSKYERYLELKHQGGFYSPFEIRIGGLVKKKNWDQPPEKVRSQHLGPSSD
jgi:hypothetical protein